jgi:hypothetical protein
MDNDEDTREDRKARYERMARAIAHNTGDPQPPMIDATALFTVTVANGSLDSEAAKHALQAAVENGDVLRWRDAEGGVRYGLTDSGIKGTSDVSRPLLSPADEDALRDIIETEADRADPNRDVIGWANRRLAALEG